MEFSLSSGYGGGHCMLRWIHKASVIEGIEFRVSSSVLGMRDTSEDVVL